MKTLAILQQRCQHVQGDLLYTAAAIAVICEELDAIKEKLHQEVTSDDVA